VAGVVVHCTTRAAGGVAAACPGIRVRAAGGGQRLVGAATGRLRVLGGAEPRVRRAAPMPACAAAKGGIVLILIPTRSGGGALDACWRASAAWPDARGGFHIDGGGRRPQSAWQLRRLPSPRRWCSRRSVRWRDLRERRARGRCARVEHLRGGLALARRKLWKRSEDSIPRSIPPGSRSGPRPAPRDRGCPSATAGGPLRHHAGEQVATSGLWPFLYMYYRNLTASRQATTEGAGRAARGWP